MATRNIVPRANGEGGIGTTVKRWGQAFFDNLTLTNDLTVPYGGTGKSTCVAYAVQCGGTTSTGIHQDVVSVGGDGQVLTSHGAGTLPTFQDTPVANIGKQLMVAQGFNLN